jgi:hypothetical protein
MVIMQTPIKVRYPLTTFIGLILLEPISKEAI